MLLTDEEIEVYLQSFQEGDEGSLIKAVAKAQLKKVVEYLERVSFEEFCDTVPENCYKRYRVMTIDIWEALLEEVK